MIDPSDDFDDEEDTQFVRKQWVREQLQMRVSEFTFPINFKIFCGSYNLHAKSKLDDSTALPAWLCPGGQADAELYAVSFQEIVKLNAVNVAVDVKGDKITSYWEDTILSCLNNRCGPGGPFVHLASKQLVGALICVFLRERHLVHCMDVRTASTACGVMGVMGNKGGVVVRMKLYHSTLCFIGGHLAAKRDNVEGRNSDYHNITENTFLYPSASRRGSYKIGETAAALEDEDRPLLLQAAHQIKEPYVRIPDHDVIFWIGDLNYRFESSLTLDDILEKCAAKDIEYLRAHDQLLIEKAAGRIFEGFVEGTLNFLPTYKFIPGTDEYDNRPDKKLRPPAWCDRILWRVRQPPAANATEESQKDKVIPPAMPSTDEAECDDLSPEEARNSGDGIISVAQELYSPGQVLKHEMQQKLVPNRVVSYGEHSVEQLYYNSCNALKISDHKPIASLFNCTLRQLDKDKELEIFKALVRVLDKMENAGVPKLDVKGLDIDAGLARFKIPYVARIRMLNIGFSIVRWKLASRPGTKFSCPPWIRVSRTMGMIAPGEAAEIELSVLFDAAAVRALDNEVIRQIPYLGLSQEVLRQLNEIPEQRFEEMLLLRVQNGRDFFITVNASYKPCGDGDDASIDPKRDPNQSGEVSNPVLKDELQRLSFSDAAKSDMVYGGDEDESTTAGPTRKIDKLRAAAAATAAKMKDRAEVLKDKAGAQSQVVSEKLRVALSKPRHEKSESSGAPAVPHSNSTNSKPSRLSDLTRFNLFDDGKPAHAAK